MQNLPFLFLAGIFLIFFFAVGASSWRFRLPSVLVYILLGTAVASYVADMETVHTVGEIGIVLLFFVLGLDFPLARMVDISRRIWPAGLLDLGLNLGLSMALALAFGLDLFSAFVLGSVAYATSSSITAKLLEDKKRLANLETEFILALLIFEDLVAPVLVSFIVGIQSGGPVSVAFMGLLGLKVVLLVLGAIFLGYYGFRKLNDFVARHLDKDFMPLFAVGLALTYAGFALYLGVSEVLGAFLAGIMLSETGKAKDLENLTVPLRNLTLPFFFFWFGTTISLNQGLPMAGFMLAFLAWSVLGKLFTGYFGGRIFGLAPKASTRAAFSMIQRGEFSAIIASWASPQLRIFSGLYILVSASIGVLLLGRAPRIAARFNGRHSIGAQSPNQLH
ncbi:MAG: cation:proton antiporter [Desulfohalobiaceae bacterium]|nr:cation:proton antiporter [Desulfohalobiaceae bacterium]